MPRLIPLDSNLALRRCNAVPARRARLPLIVAVAALSHLLLWLGQAQAATLTDVVVHLTSDLPFQHRSYFTVVFTTATAGAIKTIVIFPAGGSGTEIAAARLLEVQGIGAGTGAPGGGVFTYTVTTAVNVPAGTRITLVIADMPNLMTNPAGGLLNISTNDSAGASIDDASAPYAVRKVRAGDIAADAVTGVELAGVNNIQFGKCSINPPAISDNGHRFLHVPTCSLGLTGSANVIAFPGGLLAAGSEGLHPRLVPKGSYAHCEPACHLDVVIKNTAPAPGSVDDGPKEWAWIAWN